MDRRQEQIMDRAFWCVIIVIYIMTGIFIALGLDGLWLLFAMVGLALVTLFCIEQIVEKGNLFRKSSPMQQIHFLYGKCDRCGDEFVITTTNQNNDTQPIQTVKLNDQERHLYSKCKNILYKEFNKSCKNGKIHYSSDLIGSIFDQTRK